MPRDPRQPCHPSCHCLDVHEAREGQVQRQALRFTGEKDKAATLHCRGNKPGNVQAKHDYFHLELSVNDISNADSFGGLTRIILQALEARYNTQAGIMGIEVDSIIQDLYNYTS